MEIKAKINMEYKDSKDAEVSFNTLEVDNEGFVESEINGSILSFNIESNSLGSFLATADDLIASEILIEKILEDTKENKE
ncbi:MAG: KEOPS complex subunit Pcc1 [Methanobrevibacter sp.]|jgi:hypothetical protein|nr:KEOPS complex subunit Pcc1 [Methanobrevibacter sp.]